MATKIIKITIPGEVNGKPRMTRRDKWAQRPTVLRYRDWADLARDIVSKACGGAIPDALRVITCSWEAFFAPPASWSQKKRAAAIGQIHRVRPDRDNIDKAVLDSLWKRDEAIGRGFIAKTWAEVSRLEITLEFEE